MACHLARTARAIARRRPVGTHPQIAYALPCSVAFALMMIFFGSSGASACDEFASRLLDKAIRPSIETLDCGSLGKAGLNVSDHHLLEHLLHVRWSDLEY